MQISVKDVPGILLCMGIASIAWILGNFFPIIGGPVFAILLGMLLVMLFPDWIQTKVHKSYSFVPGMRFTSKKILQLAIIFLGFEMNLYNVFKVGGQSLLIILFTLSSAFLTAFLLGKWLKVNPKMTTLVGVGTAICGGSAIAAVAPVIEADDESIAQAISTIFLFNILAVFLFPFLGRLLHLSDLGFGMWAGTAVNDTSSVVATGVAWSALSGNTTALTFATIVKLTRTLMIVPICLFLSVYMVRSKSVSRHNASGQTNHAVSGTQKEKSADSQHFSFIKIFPWFVIGFLLSALVNTFTGLPESFSHLLAQSGKFMIVMAMSAIGLNTHLRKLLTNGLKPIALGLGCWFVVASVSLIVQYGLGLF